MVVSVVSAEIVLSELARNRSRIYGMLASLYSRPADDLEFEVFRHWNYTKADLPDGSFPQEMERGVQKINAWLGADCSQPFHEYKVKLQSEYVRLFRGLRRGTSPPPPYESVYIDDGVLYGPSTDQVASKYRQFNLIIESDEPPDHLALELDFMRFLCEKEAKTRQENYVIVDLLKEQIMFLTEHIAHWLPSLCESVRNSCETGFYSGLADFTEGWIAFDQEIIREMLCEERYGANLC